MPAAAGEPFRGVAWIELSDVGGQRYYGVSIDDLDFLTTPNPGDQTTWEGAPGSSVTLRFEWAVANVPLFSDADSVRIQMRLPGTATVVGAEWTPVIAGGSGVATQTFHFDDNPLNGTAGTARWGMLEIFVQVERTAAVSWGPVNTIGGGTPPAGAAFAWARGYLRAKGTLSSFTITKDSLGGSDEPATWAYPDSIFTRANIANTAYESYSLTAKLRDGSTTPRSSVTSGTGVQRDYSWTAASGATAKVLADFTTQAYDLDFEIVSAQFGGDEKYAWATSGHATGLARISELILRDDVRFNVNPTVTVQALTRTSSLAVVNFGFHTVTGTFEVWNARSEKLTSTHGADANMVVQSRDIVAGADQKTISASLAPNASGLYSVSYTYNGPTLIANRGTGTDGDTAAHNTSGRTKTIKVTAAGAGTRPAANSSSTLVSLSDLLRLDVHPEGDSTLTQDADPYVNPGSGEKVNYVISADTLNMFAFVGDVNGAGRSGITATLQLFKPDGTQSSTTRTQSTQSGGNLGWTTTAEQFDVVPPGGNWTGRITVELNATGASGNYGDSAVSPFGSLDQTLGFSSAYTAHRAVAIHAPDEAGIGIQIRLSVEYKESGSRVALDAAPTMRIYKLDTNGAQTEELASASMTQYAGQSSWYRDWTPSAAGTYIIDVQGLYSGGTVQASEPVTVRPKFDPVAIALHDVLVSRL